MTYAEVTHNHKKDDKTEKESYILPGLSKLYERLYIIQSIYIFIKYFPNFSCVFRKSFNVQHCILAMVEKWHKTLDEDGETGTASANLSKAFDCIDCNLLTPKLFI